MAPAENLEVVRRAIAALSAIDVDGYLACCADDVELRPVTIGVDGTYEGEAGVRRLFADLRDSASELQLEVQRLEAVDADRVLGFLAATATGRASGVRMDFPITNVWELTEGKIRRVRAFADSADALESVGLAE